MSTYFGDLQHTGLLGQSIEPKAALTANTNGAGVDMQLGGANNFNAIFDVGVYNVGTGDEVYTVNITESSDNLTFTALATPVSFVLSAVLGALGTKQANTLWGMRSKRYLRAELTVAGTGPSIFLSVLFLEALKTPGAGGGYYSAGAVA
jgi:hypothetical protein